MKKALIGLLLALTAGCTTANQGFPNPGIYTLAGSKAPVATYREIDTNFDGKRDFCEIEVLNVHENGKTTVYALHRYSKNGELEKNPLMLRETSVKDEKREGKTYRVMSIHTSYDCGTKPITKKEDLPEWDKFNPDGKSDLDTYMSLEAEVLQPEIEEKKEVINLEERDPDERLT